MYAIRQERLHRICLSGIVHFPITISGPITSEWFSVAQLHYSTEQHHYNSETLTVYRDQAATVVLKSSDFRWSSTSLFRFFKCLLLNKSDEVSNISFESEMFKISLHETFSLYFTMVYNWLQFCPYLENFTILKSDFAQQNFEIKRLKIGLVTLILKVKKATMPFFRKKIYFANDDLP